MKTGINLLLWTTHVTEAHQPILENIKATGYQGAEIPIHQTDPASYRKLATILDDLGLQRTASTALPGPQANLIGADPASRRAAVSHLRSAIDCARALGATTLIGPVYQALCEFTGKPPSEDEFHRAEEGLRTIAEHALLAEVTVCLEPLNRFECHLINTVEAGRQLAARVNHPNLRVMYDTFHANIEETDPLGAIDTHASAIAHVHISENHRGTPGTGHLPLLETIRKFNHLGYQGWFVIESFGTALPELAAATRCWRKTFASEDAVLAGGQDLFRSAMG